MILEQASIVDVTDTMVWVETRQKSTCGSCAARAGCGQQLLTRWLQGESKQDNALKVRFDMLNRPELGPNSLKPGDQVEIGIQEGALVSASLVSYGLPLLGILAGAGLAERLGLPVIIVVFLALLSLVGAAIVGRLWQSTWHSDYFEPVLVRKLSTV